MKHAGSSFGVYFLNHVDVLHDFDFGFSSQGRSVRIFFEQNSNYGCKHVQIKQRRRYDLLRERNPVPHKECIAMASEIYH
ncbi:hypothetical protein MKW98_003552 [Papaver atlanticum]|uniref:Uncharacterized protein n=1 Tax=Papaver atlanticum TaxID=357466 RepID=A0AAD4T8X6_9MAGN|nr:hypothetical protein MKW98_003552 [Papaver atlanticum]